MKCSLLLTLQLQQLHIVSVCVTISAEIRCKMPLKLYEIQLWRQMIVFLRLFAVNTIFAPTWSSAHTEPVHTLNRLMTNI